MIVTSHKLLEKYEVAFHTEQEKKSLISHLTREGFIVEKEWMCPFNYEIMFYVQFVRVDRDLLNDESEHFEKD